MSSRPFLVLTLSSFYKIFGKQSERNEPFIYSNTIVFRKFKTKFTSNYRLKRLR